MIRRFRRRRVRRLLVLGAVAYAAGRYRQRRLTENERAARTRATG